MKHYNYCCKADTVLHTVGTSQQMTCWGQPCRKVVHFSEVQNVLTK